MGHRITDPGAPRRRVRELEAAAARLRRAEAELRYVVTSARCLLWHAAVHEAGGELRWDLRVWDEEAARRFLPLAVRPAETYADAWLRCRSEEARERSAELAEAALRAGESAYSHEFRCRREDGEERCIWEDVRVEARSSPDGAR